MFITTQNNGLRDTLAVFMKCHTFLGKPSASLAQKPPYLAGTSGRKRRIQRGFFQFFIFCCRISARFRNELITTDTTQPTLFEIE